MDEFLEIATWARGYKTFSMLNSAENEICPAYKIFNMNNLNWFSCKAELSMKFFLLINIKMPTIVGILIFISRKIFLLTWVEHEKSFITSGPAAVVNWYRPELAWYYLRCFRFNIGFCVRFDSGDRLADIPTLWKDLNMVCRQSLKSFGPRESTKTGTLV